MTLRCCAAFIGRSGLVRFRAVPLPLSGPSRAVLGRALGRLGSLRTQVVLRVRRLDHIDPPNGRQPSRTAEAQAALAGLAASFRPNTGTAWWLEDGLNAPGPYDDMEIRPAAERCLLGFSTGPPLLTGG